MKKMFMQVWEGIMGSLDPTDKGFSSRKITGFAIVACVIAAHIKWLTLGNLENLEMVLTIDYGFIAALFGMTTYSSIKLKEKKTDESEVK